MTESEKDAASGLGATSASTRPAPRRSGRGGVPLVLSLHVPKTGGTTFAAVLRRAYGPRVAFFYGPGHPETHPLLSGLGRAAEPDLVARLERAGIAVLHGHFAASVFADAVPDPSRYWIWLREPVERTISHFHFFRSMHNARSALGKQVANGTMPLAAFAAQPAIRNLQCRYVAPFAIADFGFVGVTEQIPGGVGQLGLPMPAGRAASANTNRSKPSTDKQTRAAVAAENIADTALYSEAVQVFQRRLIDGVTLPAPPPQGLVARTLSVFKGR